MMGTTKHCPQCKHPMDINREEYEAFCHDCMIVVGMPRSAFNDLKAMAADFEGDEDAFAESVIVPDMARRAYHAARKETR